MNVEPKQESNKVPQPPPINEKSSGEKEARALMEFISIEALPAWFAIFATIIYAAGFLIEFTFFNSMGIKDSMGEIFKAKYIYVGLLCAQLPISLGVVIIGYFRVKRKIASGEKLKAYRPTILIMLNLLIAFYFLAAFCDPDFSVIINGRLGFCLFA